MGKRKSENGREESFLPSVEMTDKEKRRWDGLKSAPTLVKNWEQEVRMPA